MQHILWPRRFTKNSLMLENGNLTAYEKSITCITSLQIFLLGFHCGDWTRPSGYHGPSPVVYHSADDATCVVQHGTILQPAQVRLFHDCVRLPCKGLISINQHWVLIYTLIKELVKVGHMGIKSHILIE